jgi:hypothetical protein
MHPLFLNFAYLSIRNVEADELHALHLGTSQCLLGSILWLLVFRRLGNSAAENMNTIWSDILEKYKFFGITDQFSGVTISSFTEATRRGENYPRLKGKGGEVKHLMLPLTEVWKKYCNKSMHDKHALSCLEFMNDIHQILDNHKHDMFFSDENVDSFVMVTDRVLQTYSVLANEATARGELLFSVVPKFHWLWHLANRSQHLNPRRVSCFIDEDVFKHVKKLASSCCESNALHLVPGQLILKYRWALSLEKYCV